LSKNLGDVMDSSKAIFALGAGLVVSVSSSAQAALNNAVSTEQKLQALSAAAQQEQIFLRTPAGKKIRVAPSAPPRPFGDGG
jgi:hypothetical protein